MLFEDAPVPHGQRIVISLIAGVRTALALSLIVAVVMGMETASSPAVRHVGLLSDITSNFLLSLVVSLPFGFILVPAVSLLFRRVHWSLRLLAYLMTAAGFTQWLLPYSPQGDAIPFLAFAALGGLVCFAVERQLLTSSRILNILSP